MQYEIVICTYAELRRQQLVACVAAALRELPPTGRITVVVDHASQLLRQLREHYDAEARVRVCANTRQRGLSGARNTAVVESAADVLVFLDDDAVLQPGWVAALEDRFADSNTSAVAGLVTAEWETDQPTWFPQEFSWVVGCDDHSNAPDGDAVRNPIGACMAIRRSGFLQIGLFAEGLGRIGSHPVGGEETDWCLRLRAAVPAARIIRDARFTVKHWVPEHRARVGYLRRRCFWEGRSKALLQARSALAQSLHTERAHVFTTVRNAVIRDFRQSLRGEAGALLRNGVRLLGLSSAALGFLTSQRGERKRAVLEGSPYAGCQVTVCVATLGQNRTLTDTVRAILAQEDVSMEVLVVDNDPHSGHTVAALAAITDARLRIVNEPRRGLSAARNRGIAAARGAMLVFTDDDAIPQPGWLAALVSAMTDPAVLCVTGRVIADSTSLDVERWFEEAVGFDKGDARVEWGRVDGPAAGWQAGPQGPVYPVAAGEFGSGNNMAFSRAFLVGQGGFSEALGAGSLTRGGEDLDMFRRVILAGGVLRYEPGATVRHRHRQTYSALRSQLFGYGTGMAANVTRLAWVSPRHALQVLRALPAGARMLFQKDSSKNAGRPRDFPQRLVWAERLGYVCGPWLFVLAAVRHTCASLVSSRREGSAHA